MSSKTAVSRFSGAALGPESGIVLPSANCRSSPGRSWSTERPRRSQEIGLGSCLPMPGDPRASGRGCHQLAFLPWNTRFSTHCPSSIRATLLRPSSNLSILRLAQVSGRGAHSPAARCALGIRQSSPLSLKGFFQGDGPGELRGRRLAAQGLVQGRAPRGSSQAANPAPQARPGRGLDASSKGLSPGPGSHPAHPCSSLLVSRSCRLHPPRP